MRNFVKIIIFLSTLLFPFLGNNSTTSANDWGEGLDPIMFLGANPTDPENPTALEIVKKNFYYWHSEFADNVTWKVGPVKYKGEPCVAAVLRINKRGQERGSPCFRYRKLCKKEGKGIDYKEFITWTGPEDIRGISVLTWSHTDKSKDDFCWLWIPTLRKVRRLTSSQGEDSIMGADWTYDEMGLREPSDETHKIIGTGIIDDDYIKSTQESLKDFPRHKERFEALLMGAKSGEKNFYGQTLQELKGTECYIIESTQHKEYLKYDKRVWWVDKKRYFHYLDKNYDAKGKLVKEFNETWQEDKNHPGWYWEGWSDMRSFNSMHSTLMCIAPLTFNVEMDDTLFELKALSRVH